MLGFSIGAGLGYRPRAAGGGDPAATPIEVVTTPAVYGSPPALPGHLAGDLVVSWRLRLTDSTDTISAPWTEAEIFADADGQPFSLHVAYAVAATDNALTYPMTGSGIHTFFHFRHAAYVQSALDSAASGTAFTVPAPGVALGADSWIIGGAGTRADYTGVEISGLLPVEMTERAKHAAGGPNMLVFDSDGIIAEFAGSGATLSAQSGGWASWIMELAPA